MHFNANNAILLHIRSMLETIESRKQLKIWKNELTEVSCPSADFWLILIASANFRKPAGDGGHQGPL